MRVRKFTVRLLIFCLLVANIAWAADVNNESIIGHTDVGERHGYYDLDADCDDATCQHYYHGAAYLSGLLYKVTVNVSLPTLPVPLLVSQSPRASPVELPFKPPIS